MAPQNRDEYRQLSVETLEWMLNEVRSHHDALIELKTERRMESRGAQLLLGFLGGIISGAVGPLILKLLHVTP